MALMAQAEVATLGDEAVRYLQDLLRIDTTNPPGNETEAVSYLAGVLRGEGYEPRVIESSPGRGNVVARYAGTGELGPLLVYGHVDVVTTEPHHWSHPPFSGALADGCLWGRGAVDMKSMVVQELMVMLLLRRGGLQLKRDVIFAATADEEVGGAAGMGFLVDHHPDLIRAEHGLSEGGGTTMYIAGRPFYDVRTAEKGTCRFKVRAHGSPGHGSVPRPETAVSRIAEAVLKLSSTPLPFRPTSTVATLFKLLTESLGIPRERRQFNERNLQFMLQMLPPDFGQYLHAITHDTAVPTGLRAGQKINVIPGEAEASVDGRYLPGQTADGFLREVRQVIGDGYEVEPTDMSHPLEDAPGGPLYETIVSVMRRHAPEATLLPITLAGATDAKHVHRMGTSCLGFSPLRVSEGFPIEQLVHGHNERIPIDGYMWGIQVLFDIVTQFCSSG